MINWIKGLFYADNIPKDCNDLPEVNPPKSEKDISEPVWVIGKSFSDYPSRWKVEKNKSDLGANYTIFDLKTGEKFFVKPFIFQKYQTIPDPYTGEKRTYLGTDFHYKVDTTWMTCDENNFIVEEFIKMVDLKKNRIENIRRVRQNKERQRLMEIYK